MMEDDKTAYSFVKELVGFQYELDGRDRIWRLDFPAKDEQCYQLLVKKYADAFYILPGEGEESTGQGAGGS